MRRSSVAVFAALLLTGCGGSPMVSEGDPVPSPYDGPMTGTEEAPVAERAGVAVRALPAAKEPIGCA